MTLAVATVKGGFFEQYGSTVTQVATTDQGKKFISQTLAHKGQRKLRRLMYVLTGAVAGTTATATNGRVAASSELGGKRTIETETLINRASAAADVTEIKEDLLTANRTTFGASPPVNKDGNPLGTR